MKQVISEISSPDVQEILSAAEETALEGPDCANADMTLVNSAVKFVEGSEDIVQTYENIRDSLTYV